MKAFDYDPLFKKSTLSNGVRILTEHHPCTRATSVGFYVDLGTRDEPQNLSGAAHLVEHLLFKGTKNRTAYKIVADLEAVGGEINAYTSREYTCFHGATLREHSQISMDVLSDLIVNASLDSEDLSKEKEVIIQEINMAKDQLDEYIFDLFFEESYKGHPLSRSILGNTDELLAISREQIFDFYSQRYHGENLIVAIAGDVSHEKALKELSALESINRPHAQVAARMIPQFVPFRKIVERPAEQLHLLIGFPTSSFKSETRFEAYIVNAILGGGMTSKLYQNIREERALAYNVFSYLHSYTDSGLIMIYAGTSADSAEAVLAEIRKELETLVKRGLTSKELEFYKTQVMGQVLLGADDIENRMNSIAINEMVFSRYRPVDEVVSEIEGISLESIQKYIAESFPFDEASTLMLGALPDGAESLISKFF